MRRLTTLVALTAALLLSLSGIAFATAEVTITDDGLDPESVEAGVREDIVWTNASDADVSLVGKSPAWESGAIQPGATFSIKVTQKGTYEYASDDGSLEGEIVVGGGDVAAEEDDAKGDAAVTEPDEDKNDTGDRSGAGAGDDALPQTGIDVTLPGVLSVLLVALGAGLLLVTRPVARATA